jgi:hypothetical protein
LREQRGEQKDSGSRATAIQGTPRDSATSGAPINGIAYEDQLLFIFSLIPIVGVAFKVGEATKIGWYSDLQKVLHNISLETVS